MQNWDSLKILLKKGFVARINKFLVLPNGYDPDIYAAAPVEAFDNFTIIY